MFKTLQLRKNYLRIYDDLKIIKLHRELLLLNEKILIYTFLIHIKVSYPFELF